MMGWTANVYGIQGEFQNLQLLKPPMIGLRRCWFLTIMFQRWNISSSGQPALVTLQNDLLSSHKENEMVVGLQFWY